MKKSIFFSWVFRNISKTTETILIKKIEQTRGALVYKKVLMSEHRKNYKFFEILTVLSKCLLVRRHKVHIE